MSIALDALRDCLEGAAPALIATCAADGTPNVSYLSQVQYVDRDHVALTFQFFNKTRANVLANPRARLMVIHPASGAMYRLTVEYLRTEAEGALFESMRARLASIASHTGMTGVFRLLGADVYRVQAIELAHRPATGAPNGELTGEPSAAPPGPNRLAALRAVVTALAGCADLESLFDATLAGLREHFEVRHAMFLLLDAGAARLYTVASLGYEASGIGSEIPLGAGVIGVAARAGAPIRLSRLTADYAYGRAIREAALREGTGGVSEREIPFPGLSGSHSQLAVPIPMAGHTVGVLFVESPQDMRFGYDDEDALVALAAHVGQRLHVLQISDDHESPVADPPSPVPTAQDAQGAQGAQGVQDAQGAQGAQGAQTAQGVAGTVVTVRRYRVDGSIFLDDAYLIKGVAGAVFWAVVSDHAERGRTDFSNRELRLDPRIRLPDFGDNLEARLVLLQRRLVERGACVQIERTGRGRFRVCVTRPMTLVEVG